MAAGRTTRLWEEGGGKREEEEWGSPEEGGRSRVYMCLFACHSRCFSSRFIFVSSVGVGGRGRVGREGLPDARYVTSSLGTPPTVPRGAPINMFA